MAIGIGAQMARRYNLPHRGSGSLSSSNITDAQAAGESAWTLVSSRDRRLKQTMPIDGKVVAVNQELIEDPDLANSSPYEKGWILYRR